eukprot:1425876-Pyramimonas_sp.AAC.1
MQSIVIRNKFHMCCDFGSSFLWLRKRRRRRLGRRRRPRWPARQLRRQWHTPRAWRPSLQRLGPRSMPPTGSPSSTLAGIASSSTRSRTWSARSTSARPCGLSSRTSRPRRAPWPPRRRRSRRGWSRWSP